MLILKIPRSKPISESIRILIISRIKLGGKSQKERLFKREKAMSRDRRGNKPIPKLPIKKGIKIKKNNHMV